MSIGIPTRQLVRRQALHLPSYEIERVEDGVRIAVPGFQPFAVYDVVLANLVPGLDRNPPPESVEEVLRWTAIPLASKEVAVVCDIELDEARAESRTKGRNSAGSRIRNP